MNRNDDRLYYSRRAATERARADASTDTSVALVHRAMAAEYERRAQGDSSKGRETSTMPVPRAEYAMPLQ
jgi:hypothetical protein